MGEVECALGVIIPAAAPETTGNKTSREVGAVQRRRHRGTRSGLIDFFEFRVKSSLSDPASAVLQAVAEAGGVDVIGKHGGCVRCPVLTGTHLFIVDFRRTLILSIQSLVFRPRTHCKVPLIFRAVAFPAKSRHFCCSASDDTHQETARHRGGELQVKGKNK
ncbi:hypothetical protein EYF80_050686 [Liparis tanakae]|uniref:Uncharacterized protein n=1 Tax=Liparis tanakae TaxID=230148 RepID=A0A4Z2FD86_9TELE|nr:hypothetical protein EYF80_050686 [Liparis tanakae]